MYGIVAGVDGGKFVKFTDFTFNPLEEATEKELAENIKSYAEVASALVSLGAKQDEVFEWLKQFKQFNLDGLSFDTETEGLGGYEDITPQVMSEFQAMNWVEDPERWITMKKQPVPVEKGESSKDAAKRFLEEKGRKFKERDGGEKTEETREEKIPDISQYSKKDLQRLKDRNFELYQKVVEKAARDSRAGDERFAKGGFELVKETTKAYQLQKDGKTFWIQKRWLKEDGSLTSAGQKAFEQERTDEEKKQDKEEYIRRRKEGVKRPAKADWESDKAYGYDINLDFYDIEKDIRHRIFIPKSVIQPNGNIPTWIMEKKLEEIEEKYPHSRYGGFSIDRHPFDDYSFGFKDWSRLDPDDESEDSEFGNKTHNSAMVVYSVQNNVLCKSYDNGETWVDCEAWREEDHPRGKDGKFGQGGGDNEKDRKADVEEKISKIKIDFTKDNILPELNAGDLEELGVKSKPVLLKKTVIDRNLSQHPDVEVEDYEMMIGKALYDADAILPGNAEKPYYNFIARVSGEKNSVVLLEVADNKDNFEIVHFHWAKNKQRRTLEKKAERIKEKS